MYACVSHWNTRVGSVQVQRTGRGQKGCQSPPQDSRNNRWPLLWRPPPPHSSILHRPPIPHSSRNPPSTFIPDPPLSPPHCDLQQTPRNLHLSQYLLFLHNSFSPTFFSSSHIFLLFTRCFSQLHIYRKQTTVSFKSFLHSTFSFKKHSSRTLLLQSFSGPIPWSPEPPERPPNHHLSSSFPPQLSVIRGFLPLYAWTSITPLASPCCCYFPCLITPSTSYFQSVYSHFHFLIFSVFFLSLQMSFSFGKKSTDRDFPRGSGGNYTNWQRRSISVYVGYLEVADSINLFPIWLKTWKEAFHLRVRLREETRQADTIK